jgi:alkanesulfonate monooxygenase SsuD/methylene tetrahydromethanopterin reductase-like flavin-dependent oxidoreductase (luciferase family)
LTNPLCGRVILLPMPLKETINTALLADRLGYTRFWVSEHHNATSIAGSAPELLMVKLANDTTHLPHRFGAYHVAQP